MRPDGTGGWIVQGYVEREPGDTRTQITVGEYLREARDRLGKTLTVLAKTGGK